MRQRTHRALIHQRQESLQLRRNDARLHHLQESRQLGISLGGSIKRRAQTVHRVVSEREFAAGVNLYRLLVANGLARRRNHAADAIDLVAKKLNAHGRRRLRRKDINRVAVHMEKPWGVRLVSRGVPHTYQTRRYILKRNLLSHRKRSRSPVGAFARRHTTQECARRGHHDARLARGNTPQRGAACSNHSVVRLLVFPGIVGALRETHHVLGTYVGNERSSRAISCVFTRNYIDARPGATRKLCRKHKRARRERDR